MKRSPETKEEQERQCLIDSASKREKEKTLVVQACKELVRVFGIVRRHLPIYLSIVPLRTLSLSLSLSLSISTISVPIYAVLRQVTRGKYRQRAEHCPREPLGIVWSFGTGISGLLWLYSSLLARLQYDIREILTPAGIYAERFSVHKKEL